MDLSRIWIEYCERRLGPAAATAATMSLSPKETHALLFEWNGLFTPRAAILRGVAYSTAFDDEADAALREMACADSFRSWDGLSAGAWRVLIERLKYAQGVALSNEVAGTDVISALPAGLSRRDRSRAVGLQFLLGGARSIPARWLDDKANEEPARFPATTPLRPQ